LKSTDVGRVYLWKDLKALSSLKSIHLNWRLQNITNEALKNFSKGLKELTSLKYLSLKFQSYIDLIDEGLKSLGEGLKRLKSLESIWLDFDSYSSKLSDSGLYWFSKALQKIKSLKSLSFWFRGTTYCRCMMHKGFGDFFYGFQLENIDLSLASSNITDEALSSIGRYLGTMTSLRSIRLVFQISFSITDQGLNNLGEFLKRTNSLRDITITFEYCQNVTRGACHNLEKDLLQLNSVDNVSINHIVWI